MEQRRCAGVEQFVIHTQRDDFPGRNRIPVLDQQHVGWPRASGRRSPHDCRRNKNSSALSSPRRRQRLAHQRKAGCGSLRGALRSNCHGSIEHLPAEARNDEPEEEEEEEELELALEELRRDNDDLKLQVQLLKDEQAVTAEAHARVMAVVVKERQELYEQLQRCVCSGAQQQLEFDAVGDVLKLPEKEDACGTLDEQPEITGAKNTEDYREAEGDEKVEEKSFGNSEEGKMLRTKYATARCETLASRAQCWEMQGALRKAQQEKQNIESKMNAATRPVLSAPPVVCCIPALSQRSSVPSPAMSPIFPPRIPVTRQTFGGFTASAPVLVAAAPAPATPATPLQRTSSCRKTSPSRLPWSLDGANAIPAGAATRESTPSRRLAGTTTPTPVRLRIADSSPSRHGGNSPPVSWGSPAPVSPGMPPKPRGPPPPVAQGPPVVMANHTNGSSTRSLTPSASAPALALTTQATASASHCIAKNATWTWEHSTPHRDSSPAHRPACPCCGANARS